jgi:hypothetical protein
VGKKPLGRVGHKWEYNIKMGFREIEWGTMNWIDLAQWRAPMNTVMTIRVSDNIGYS